MQCLPGITCFTAVSNVSYVLYTLSSPFAWHFNRLSPQGVVITLCACGLFALLVTMISIPAEVRLAHLRAPTFNPAKHTNLLGLVRTLCVVQLAGTRVCQGQMQLCACDASSVCMAGQQQRPSLVCPCQKQCQPQFCVSCQGAPNFDFP